ncbi:tyrosine-type recombinase/integrase [Actinomadura violacea]|uniref:Site-specific integrase n=1 Tax=Actinomadura violacea TaxID=2819934 RepID=A0ABS3RSX3_9ACTN|nr:site-specific integrase [Actinomadura violacea]MBO2459866.1 site-specific integrase [Actinomadura violacea]
MKPFKRCWCRDAAGKLLGKKCPDLAKRGHGKWYGRYEAPAGADGKRRQPTIGPYDTEKECKRALGEAVGAAGSGDIAEDRKITVGEYLERRHGWRVSESTSAGEGLKKSTLNTDRELIDLYLKPGLGHLKLADLRDGHIRDLYAAMRQINRLPEGEKPNELLRRLLLVRAARTGGKAYSTKPLSEARIKRVHICLNAALNDAVRVSKILRSNPAVSIFKTKGGSGGRKVRAKPLLWTDERVAHWEKTGEVPAKVMVWTPMQAGWFLDFAESSRLYPLLHLATYWGLRRGELIGQAWADADLSKSTLHVRRAQQDDELDDVKSDASDRTITLDRGTVDVLTNWRQMQQAEREAWKEGWAESGRMFTQEDGREMTPKSLTDHFARLVRRYSAIRRHHAEGWSIEMIVKRSRVSPHEVEVALAGPPLPPVRFHDLRHGAATMLHAAGVSMKVVSDILGHSSESFTSDVYAVVAQELAHDAAVRIADFIPRRNRQKGPVVEPVHIACDQAMLARLRTLQRPGEDLSAVAARVIRGLLGGAETAA